MPNRLPRSDALVLFGITGDLAKKKLFPSLYRMAERDQLDVPIVGVARSTWDDSVLHDHARQAILTARGAIDESVFAKLAKQLCIVDGDYNDAATFERLAAKLEGIRWPTFYLAIPPLMFSVVAEHLAAVGLTQNGRVIVEKPFGRDLPSAIELDRILHEHFDERRIFRIDHYLGKEAVENLLVFRFANSFLEPVWNRNNIASVQVTMAEEFGVEGRGAFYEDVGAIRDVVQNHMLQVVSLLAMEPPLDKDADALRDEKVRVLKAMRPIDPSHLVRGQYVGYREEPGVAPDSTVETFAALHLRIDSWRWAGVPFYIRVGKALATTWTEAVVEFRAPPRMMFTDDAVPQPHANTIRFRLGKDDGVTLGVQAKRPGRELATRDVAMRVDFDHALGARQDAYERLLDDALDGEARRFARSDSVQQAWRVVQPAFDQPSPIYFYERGSWGPEEASELLGHHHWHQPGDEQSQI
ncbi:MAG TPA: glucose-6-phosphate dehydrogenase [Actinomycetes bacterium]|nr:glucose-6-phosphate dehydrogenase [Actinomycetes bacterium]